MLLGCAKQYGLGRCCCATAGLTYRKVKGELGSLVLDLCEVAGFLVCFKSVGKGRRVYGRDQASQKACECEYCPHCDACRQTMRL
jgi:hypothetical protein